MIERDVKHAVKLLEMSLSGLMSAENALKRWKTHIPPKVGLRLLRPRVLTCGAVRRSGDICRWMLQVMLLLYAPMSAVKNAVVLVSEA